MKAILTLSLLFLGFLCACQTKDSLVIINDQAVAASAGESTSIIHQINKNLRWPSHWLGEGTVYVKFTVDTLGIVRNPVILKGIDSIADAEVLRAVNMSPQQPLTFSAGKAVNVYYTIPVKFKIR